MKYITKDSNSKSLVSVIMINLNLTIVLHHRLFLFYDHIDLRYQMCKNMFYFLNKRRNYFLNKII
jgi:hypothetical protein